MDIQLLTVGKTNQGYIQVGIDEYCKRLKRYIAFSIISLPDIKSSKCLSEALQQEKEGEIILNYLSPSDMAILLDEHGKEYTSVEFAKFLQKTFASGRKRAVFIVGGPYGFSEAVYRRADTKCSLSKMTFTHEMVRLFFTEQVYRAMTIIKGEPYHHE